MDGGQAAIVAKLTVLKQIHTMRPALNRQAKRAAGDDAHSNHGGQAGQALLVPASEAPACRSTLVQARHTACKPGRMQAPSDSLQQKAGSADVKQAETGRGRSSWASPGSLGAFSAACTKSGGSLQQPLTA